MIRADRQLKPVVTFKVMAQSATLFGPSSHRSKEDAREPTCESQSGGRLHTPDHLAGLQFFRCPEMGRGAGVAVRRQHVRSPLKRGAIAEVAGLHLRAISDSTFRLAP